MSARLAVDIGGTFTDVVLETANGGAHALKVLTTTDAPERGVLEAARLRMALSAVLRCARRVAPCESAANKRWYSTSAASTSELLGNAPSSPRPSAGRPT